jgi:hypothetical protein
MIILLHGLSRCGKDTVANILVKRFDFAHLKISAHLKRCASMLFEIPLEHFETREKDLVHSAWNCTPRQMLKFLGTDVCQFKIEELVPGLKRRFWIDHLHTQIAQNRANKTSIVISDYRFPHEWDSLKERFPAEVITVIRVVPSFEGFVPPKDLDESEKRLPVDFELENRNWDELDKNVEELLRTIQRRSPSNH